MINKSGRNAAVSPVIGTILLVAIAVVLTAIILTVVMGFSGDPNEKKVGLNAKPESGNNATLILYGGASIPDLTKLEMIDQGSPIGKYVEFWNISDNEAYVGIPYHVVDVAQPIEPMDVYDTRINVRGTFNDGTEVILLVQPMTFYDVAGPPPQITGYVETITFSGIDITNQLQQITSMDKSNVDPRRTESNPSGYTYGSRITGSVVISPAEGASDNIESISAELARIHTYGTGHPAKESNTLVKKGSSYQSSQVLDVVSGNPFAGGIFKLTITITDKNGDVVTDWWLISDLEFYPADFVKYPVRYDPLY